MEPHWTKGCPVDFLILDDLFVSGKPLSLTSQAASQPPLRFIFIHNLEV